LSTAVKSIAAAELVVVGAAACAISHEYPSASAALVACSGCRRRPHHPGAITDYLGQYEFRVSTVADGGAMRAVLANDAVDLIVLDLMPAA